jgi:hypothetical protein
MAIHTHDCDCKPEENSPVSYKIEHKMTEGNYPRENSATAWNRQKAIAKKAGEAIDRRDSE